MVYLLDDDPSVLKATGRLLRSAGMDVEAFDDPLLFLEHARRHHPAVALLDIWMPRMNGLEVQGRLRAESPSTRVIILTSKDDPSTRAKALEAGAAGFFLKPADHRELVAGIEAAAAGRSTSRHEQSDQ